MTAARAPGDDTGAPPPPAPVPSGDAPRGGRHSTAVAALLVRLRWAVVVGWLAVAAVLLAVPAPDQDGGLGGFVSPDNPAVATEVRSYEIFGFPLASRTAVVQRDPDGL